MQVPPLQWLSSCHITLRGSCATADLVQKVHSKIWSYQCLYCHRQRRYTREAAERPGHQLFNLLLGNPALRPNRPFSEARSLHLRADMTT